VIAVWAVLVVGLAVVGGALGVEGGALVGRAPSPPPEAIPAAAAFRPGACRAIAEPVRALAGLDRSLASATAVPAADRDRIATEQRRLLAARSAAEADLGPPLDDLITSIGYVRLRSDTHSYDAAVWTEADHHRRAVQRLCVPSR
jgi:hypothetical protein